MLFSLFLLLLYDFPSTSEILLVYFWLVSIHENLIDFIFQIVITMRTSKWKETFVSNICKGLEHWCPHSLGIIVTDSAREKLWFMQILASWGLTINTSFLRVHRNNVLHIQSLSYLYAISSFTTVGPAIHVKLYVPRSTI